MKFKLIESTEIIDKVNVNKRENEEIISNLKELFSGSYFEEVTKLNGIAFTKTEKTEYKTIQAQLYVDTTTLDYSTYLTVKTDGGDTNMSSKGKKSNILTAANELVNQLDNFR